MAPGVTFSMPVISPVFNNGHGTIKLMSVSVDASCSEASYEKLLE